MEKIAMELMEFARELSAGYNSDTDEYVDEPEDIAYDVWSRMRNHRSDDLGKALADIGYGDLARKIGRYKVPVGFENASKGRFLRVVTNLVSRAMGASERVAAAPAAGLSKLQVQVAQKRGQKIAADVKRQVIKAAYEYEGDERLNPGVENIFEGMAYVIADEVASDMNRFKRMRSSGSKERKAADWAYKMVRDIELQVDNLEQEIGQPMSMWSESEWNRAAGYIDKIWQLLRGLEKITKRADI